MVLRVGTSFFDSAQRAITIKEKAGKLKLPQNKLMLTEDIIKEMNKHTTNWEKLYLTKD